MLISWSIGHLFGSAQYERPEQVAGWRNDVSFGEGKRKRKEDVRDLEGIWEDIGRDTGTYLCNHFSNLWFTGKYATGQGETRRFVTLPRNDVYAKSFN